MATHQMQSILLLGWFTYIPRWWIEVTSDGIVKDFFWQLRGFSVPFCRDLERRNDAPGATRQKGFAPTGSLEHQGQE
jgi:hypothetical protein